MDDLMTVKEAAFELEVSERTVRRWVDEGKLDAYEVGPTKRTRIPSEAVSEARVPKRKSGE